MARKRLGSSAPGKRAKKSVAYMPDSALDFQDIPELTDSEIKRARRVGRPSSGNAKQLIAIRLKPQLLKTLRQMALRQHKPYQTLIHELLESIAKKAA